MSQRQNPRVRKSRRLNPDLATDKPYAILRSLEGLRDVWPAKKLPGHTDWCWLHPDSDDDSLDAWRAEYTCTRTPPALVQMPPSLDIEFQNDLIAYASVFLGVPITKRTFLNEENPQLYRAAESDRGYGRQIDSSRVLGYMQTICDPDWMVLITEHDLGHENMNYLFGLSSFNSTVCVLSAVRWIAECDDSACFRGLAHTLVHEMGHNLLMQHCTTNQCIMNGHNTMEEAMAGPADFCPQCLSKLMLVERSAPFDIGPRYDRLIDILDRRGVSADVAFLNKMKVAHNKHNK
jgi:predicted Zn-dependent protease